MKNFIRLILIIVISFLINSCSKDSDTPNNQNSSENQLDEKTIVIDDTTNDLLVEITDEKLVFTSSNGQINNIEVGSILASDISENAPNGYLRKVISVESTGGTIVVKTSQASLAEAIKNVDFNYSYSIGNENIIGIDSSGVDISTNKSIYHSNKNNSGSNIEITVPINGFEIYTEGKDKITLDGSFKLTFDIDFALKIDNNSLEDFKFIQNVEVTADATLKASLENLPQISKAKVLKTISLAPLSIPVFGLPVPFAQQWIVISLGVDGGISAGFEVGTKNTSTIKAGISYNKLTGWDNLFETTNDYEPAYGDVFVKGELFGWLQARYEVRPYGLKTARIFIANQTGPKLTGEISTANASLLSLDLSWCVESNAKAEIKIFDKAIVDYNVDIYNNCFNIANWSNNANPFIGKWEAIEFRNGPADGTYFEEGYFCNILKSSGGYKDVIFEFTNNGDFIRKRTLVGFNTSFENLDANNCTWDTKRQQNYETPLTSNNNYEILDDTKIQWSGVGIGGGGTYSYVLEYEFVNSDTLLLTQGGTTGCDACGIFTRVSN